MDALAAALPRLAHAELRLQDGVPGEAAGGWEERKGGRSWRNGKADVLACIIQNMW